MQQSNFKKMLAIIGALGVVTPITTQVFGCTTTDVSRVNYDREIVAAINKVNNYSVEVVARSSVSDIRALMTASGFIKNQLDAKVKPKFNEKELHLNNIFNEQGQELKDQELTFDTEMNATFSYSYGTIYDQIAKIKIIVTENRISLSNIFKDFQFSDIRDADGFLDSNDQNDIINQVSKHIGESLELTDLTWENQTSNSILIKAKEDSKKYQGEVTLTWNLKLFELWGDPIDDAEDMDIRDGLKLYVYLDAEDSHIKVFDVAQYKIDVPVFVVDDSDVPRYLSHSLLFENNKNDWELLGIYSDQSTNDVVKDFKQFDFTTGVRVQLRVKGFPSFIQIFNKSEHQWTEQWNQEYFIDSLGNLN